MKRYQIDAGLAVRKQIRRYLLGRAVKFIEDKGWFDSVFYVDCEPEVFQHISQDLARWRAEMEAPTT